MSRPVWRRRRRKLYGSWRIYCSTEPGSTAAICYLPGKLELRRWKRGEA